MVHTGEIDEPVTVTIATGRCMTPDVDILTALNNSQTPPTAYNAT